MRTQQLYLYLLVLFLIVAVVIIALGGGIFDQKSPWPFQWQHHAFLYLCHQLPERSFWINGQPMAVCSRCMGIYSGFALGWLLLPIWSMVRLKEGWPMKKITLAALLINFVDIIGNIFGFWENTLVSRLAWGCLMGSTAALMFSGDFFIINEKSKGNHYGRITEPIARK